MKGELRWKQRGCGELWELFRCVRMVAWSRVVVMRCCKTWIWELVHR